MTRGGRSALEANKIGEKFGSLGSASRKQVISVPVEIRYTIQRYFRQAITYSSG